MANDVNVSFYIWGQTVETMSVAEVNGNPEVGKMSQSSFTKSYYYFTTWTLVWCWGLWDPFSMFTKRKIIQLIICSTWDSLAHFLWRTCKIAHFHWVDTVHPPTHLYYICGVLTTGPEANKRVEKCVWSWKEVKKTNKNVCCVPSLCLPPPPWACCFKQGTKNRSVPACLTVCHFSRTPTLCCVWNYLRDPVNVF
jgi:hypothetical protein